MEPESMPTKKRLVSKDLGLLEKEVLNMEERNKEQEESYSLRTYY